MEEFEKKHLLFVYSAESPDNSQSVLFDYWGEMPKHSPVFAYWPDSNKEKNYLTIPIWFETEAVATEFKREVIQHTLRTYYMIQERHYPPFDPRIITAKIIGHIENDFYPNASRGKTQERADEPMVDVWTFYLPEKRIAEQYVNGIQAGVNRMRADYPRQKIS